MVVSLAADSRLKHYSLFIILYSLFYQYNVTIPRNFKQKPLCVSLYRSLVQSLENNEDRR